MGNNFHQRNQPNNPKNPNNLKPGLHTPIALKYPWIIWVETMFGNQLLLTVLKPSKVWHRVLLSFLFPPVTRFRYRTVHVDGPLQHDGTEQGLAWLTFEALKAGESFIPPGARFYTALSYSDVQEIIVGALDDACGQ